MQDLPQLDPLRLIPFVGNPLTDLHLDLDSGQIQNAIPLVTLPSAGAIADLENPDNYQIPSLLDNPTLAPLVDAAFTSGLIDTLQPTS